VKKAWLAAACPAKARAMPSRPTQNVSTLLTMGTTAMFNMLGRAVLRILLSVESPKREVFSWGRAERRRALLPVDRVGDDVLPSVTIGISSGDDGVLSTSLLLA